MEESEGSASPPPISSDPLAEVMEEFEEYYVPELEDFLRLVRDNIDDSVPVTGLRPNLIARIEDLLRNGVVSKEFAYAFIDKLREHGRQHLFLFQIQEAHRGDLAQLRAKFASFSASLAEKPQAPTLTAIVETNTHLLFRWVETRAWSQAVPGQADGERHTERSVNFFRIDLGTGDAEIRIQKQRPRSEVPLLEELRMYRELVRQYVDLDHFSPLLLEPVIRRLLTSRRMAVKKWLIDWPESNGRLSGNVDPGWVQGILLRFANYFAMKLSGDWLFKRRNEKAAPRRVRASLDGENNEVEIPNRCLAEEESVILSDIRSGRGRGMQIRELGELAREHDDLRPALEVFDLHFGTLGTREIEIEEIGKDWVVGAKGERAARETAARYPDLFRLRYRVRCPESRKPVEIVGAPAEEEDKTLWFDRLDAVPKEVTCRHKKKKIAHPTAGSIEAVLIFEPPAESPPVIPGLAKFVVRWLPDEMGQQVMGGLLILLFALLYVPLLAATVWLFLRLSERFDTKTGTLFLAFAFFLALVFEAGICIVVLGKPAADAAANMLIKIASLIKPATGLKDAEVSIPKVNQLPNAGAGD